jgi:hypothetical protein
VVAGTDAGEAELRLDGFSLRDPVDGRVPWELPLPLLAGAGRTVGPQLRVHAGVGEAVAGDPGRAVVELFAPRAERGGLRLLGAGEAIGPPGEVRGEERPPGWSPAGDLAAAGQAVSGAGRLRGTLAIAPAASGWEGDPASPRGARGRRTRLLPALGRLDAEAAGVELALTALALHGERRWGRPDRILPAGEPGSERRQLGLAGLEARRRLVPGLELGLRASVLGTRLRAGPLAGEPVVDRAVRGTLLGELRVVGEAAGRHRLRASAGLEGERARRRGVDVLRPGEGVPSGGRASGRTLHAAADERYQPLPWLELEAGLRVQGVRLRGGGTIAGGPPLERTVSPGVLIAPRAAVAVRPVGGSRLTLAAGRFGGPVPLLPMLGGADAPARAPSPPAEDSALATGEIDRPGWRLAVQAIERRTARVIEDRLSPATGRLELFQPPRLRRRYRALIAAAEGRAGGSHAGLGLGWARLDGNHEGATDPYTGRLRPGATISWDATELGGAPTAGRLPLDRRLSLRLFADHTRMLPCRCRRAPRLAASAALRVDGGTPRSARGWGLEAGEGAVLLGPRGALGRTGPVASLDVGVSLTFVTAAGLTSLAIQGANLTRHRPVTAREELMTDGAGAGRPSFGNPVAWAEPLSLKLVLGLEL